MADILTKYVDRATLVKHLAGMGCHAESGRAASAPELIQQHYVQHLYVPTGRDLRKEE